MKQTDIDRIVKELVDYRNHLIQSNQKTIRELDRILSGLDPNWDTLAKMKARNPQLFAEFSEEHEDPRA